MSRKKRLWLTLVLTSLMPLGGCDTSRQSSPLFLSDNDPFKDLWSTYIHCSRSEDLDAMRADVQRLSLAVNTTAAAEDPISRESNEPVPQGRTSRLSADPAAMAASCTLRAGQAAQEMGHLDVAQEMFHRVVTNYPQPLYQYYVVQARLGLEEVDAARSASLNKLTL